MEEAQSPLDSSKIEKTKEALDQGMSFLIEREKLTLFADKLP